MIDQELLEASALGTLAPDLDAEVEEHVLSCGRCADVYARLLRLGDGVRDLVARGGIWLVATRHLTERVEQAGLVTRRYVLDVPGATIPCTVDADDVYALSTIHVELGGVARVDILYGEERIEDVPFDAAAGLVHMLTPASALRHLPTAEFPFRLLAVEPDGRERTLLTYTLAHTAYVPT